jgi:hypothetical protein
MAALESGLQDPAAAPLCLQTVHAAAQLLNNQGWETPSFPALLQCHPVPSNQPEQHQRPAAAAAHTAMRQELHASLDPASQAMMASQPGPFASRVFTTIPHTPDLAYPNHIFRLLLLRRLRLPLPLTERNCRCRRVLDPLGDHRAACPRSGILRSRGCPSKEQRQGCAEKLAPESQPQRPTVVPGRSIGC